MGLPGLRGPPGTKVQQKFNVMQIITCMLGKGEKFFSCLVMFSCIVSGCDGL